VHTGRQYEWEYEQVHTETLIQRESEYYLRQYNPNQLIAQTEVIMGYLKKQAAHSARRASKAKSPRQ
jgi:hypothetical protein